MSKKPKDEKIVELDEFIKGIKPVGYEIISNWLYKNILSHLKYMRSCIVFEVIDDKSFFSDEYLLILYSAKKIYIVVYHSKSKKRVKAIIDRYKLTPIKDNSLIKYLMNVYLSIWLITMIPFMILIWKSEDVMFILSWILLMVAINMLPPFYAFARWEKKYNTYVNETYQKTNQTKCLNASRTKNDVN